MSSFGHAGAVTKPDMAGDWVAGKLAAQLPPVSHATTCKDVYRLLRDPEAQPAFAVVDDDNRVVGLVNRLQFLARYSQRFIPELYDKRPILAMANAAALVVDENMPLAELAAKLTLDRPDALRECFVVTENDRYLGIGTSEALVSAKVAMLMAREEQLNTALNAAQDADRTRSNFLALMSHELRTPLNAIIGFSEVLAQEYFGPHTTPRYRDYARDIHGAGQHLLALINDILDLSKSEAGKLELYAEPMSIAALLEDCRRLLHGRAEEGNVALFVHVPDGFPALRADSLRLKQVVINILSNAVKFTLPGGQVEMFARLDDHGGIEIAVADTGIGMAPEMIPLALEPFRQIDSPLSRQVEGTGLGLSLAKSLTERHGGTIAIESALNHGTTVRLRFPPGRTIVSEHDAVQQA